MQDLQNCREQNNPRSCMVDFELKLKTCIRISQFDPYCWRQKRSYYEKGEEYQHKFKWST